MNPTTRFTGLLASGRAALSAGMRGDDGDELRLWLFDPEHLAEATVNRRCRTAKQFMRAAVRKRIISENPFADLKTGQSVNTDRLFFVTREMAARVLDACPDAEWRLIFALARYGGLRTPSETLALKLGDIDWERQRIRVPSPKTKQKTDESTRRIAQALCLQRIAKNCEVLRSTSSPM